MFGLGYYLIYKLESEFFCPNSSCILLCKGFWRDSIAKIAIEYLLKIILVGMYIISKNIYIYIYLSMFIYFQDISEGYRNFH